MLRILKNGFIALATLCATGHALAQVPVGTVIQPVEAPYGTLEKDLRLCAFPKCGGYWIRPLNGTIRSIYVSTLDLSDFDAASQRMITGGLGAAIVKGRIQPELAPHLGNSLDVTEAYVAQKGSLVSPLKSTFIKASQRNPPINCVTAPCPNLIADVLNTSRTVEFDRMDTSGLTSVPPEKLLLSPRVILSGMFVDGTEEFPGGYELLFSVSALYQQVPSYQRTPVIMELDASE